jgi:MYXO-CTERM domain-containing protein
LRITIASSQFTLSATVLSALFDPVPTNNTSTVTISTLLATGGCSVSSSPRTPVSLVPLLLVGALLMLRRRAPRAARPA